MPLVNDTDLATAEDHARTVIDGGVGVGEKVTIAHTLLIALAIVERLRELNQTLKESGRGR